MEQKKMRSTISPTFIASGTGYARVLVLVYSAVLLSITAPIAFADDTRPADFGKQWVRKNPFTIQALLVVDDGFKYYKELGMTSALIWKRREGIFQKAVEYNLPWQFCAFPNQRKSKAGYVMPDIDEWLEPARKLYNKYPGGQGFLIWDEPRHPAFPIMAKLMQEFRTAFPEALVYSNLYSAGAPSGKYYESRDENGQYIDPPVKYGYAEYLQEYVDLCQPDVLSFDIYPFVRYETADDISYIHIRYFDSLENIRKCALKAGIPYWSFIQAWKYRDWYLPSESDVRMQVFSSLAYGFTGMSYFIYHHPNAYPCNILTLDKKPSRLAKEIRIVNSEVQHLGKALRFLTSTDVRYIPGKHYVSKEHLVNPLPKGTRAFDADAGKACKIKDIQARGFSLSRNGLIGFFEDDNGDHYFMIVNLRRARALPAEEMEMELVIEFDESVKEIYRLSRITGEIETVPVADGKFELELPGGTGDLFKIENSTFPGIMPSK